MYKDFEKKKISWGIEPHIHGFQDRHVDHYATKPPQLNVCSLLPIATDSNLHFADCPYCNAENIVYII